MQTVFIAGSISIERLATQAKERISSAAHAGLHVVVGDADGADTSIQRHLFSIQAEAVTVFCSGDQPRNNVGNWPVERIFPDARPGTRAYFTAKDLKMAEAANYGLMIWDSKSTGTLSNVIELIKMGKKSVVFVNKSKEFMTVSDGASLEKLVDLMAPISKLKADKKMSLLSKVASLSREQLALSF
jgi:hypothetical protein